jgi:hypothetical protein
VAHAGDNFGAVGLDLHAPAAAIALLAAPKLAVDGFQRNGYAGWESGKRGHEALAVRLSGGLKSQHRRKKFYRSRTGEASTYSHEHNAIKPDFIAHPSVDSNARLSAPHRDHGTTLGIKLRTLVESGHYHIGTLMNSNTASSNLSKFDELYSAATVAEGPPFSSDIPDGEYVTVVEDATLTNGSTSTPTIVWTFRIRGGSYSDRLLRKVRPITERTVAWVKEDFMKCGLKLDAFSDLPSRIEELHGVCVPVVKRTRDGNDFGVHIQWPSTGTTRSRSGEEIPY